MKPPTDEQLLESLRAKAERLRHKENDAATLRQERLAAAAVLRERGVSMTVIAKAAGVSDSYLSRRLIDSGSSRRRSSPGVSRA